MEKRKSHQSSMFIKKQLTACSGGVRIVLRQRSDLAEEKVMCAIGRLKRNLRKSLLPLNAHISPDRSKNHVPTAADIMAHG